MKARCYALALVLAVAAVAPPAFAQRGLRASDVTARVYTSAVLKTPEGAAIGKVRTSTIHSESRGVVQTLRVTATGLTPGAEYVLVIDNTLVGSGTVNAAGALRMSFVLPARGPDAALPEAVAPISAASTVQLYAADGDEVAASGEFTGKDK